MYYCLIYVFLTYISLTNSLKYISMYIFVMKYLLKFCVLFVTWINHYLVDLKEFFQLSSVQSVSCIQICNHMNCSIPGFPVHHQLPGLTQTHDLPVGDDIQPSYPLSSPSLAFNLSQNQGLFQGQFFASCGQSIGVTASASVLPMNTQDWSPLGWTG